MKQVTITDQLLHQMLSEAYTAGTKGYAENKLSTVLAIVEKHLGKKAVAKNVVAENEFKLIFGTKPTFGG